MFGKLEYSYLKDHKKIKEFFSLPFVDEFVELYENLLVNQSGKESIMTKYKCLLCGYIYDPAKGDPDNGVDPGTPFDQIPDDWVCPECGAGKDDFEPAE